MRSISARPFARVLLCALVGATGCREPQHHSAAFVPADPGARQLFAAAKLMWDREVDRNAPEPEGLEQQREWLRGDRQAMASLRRALDMPITFPLSPSDRVDYAADWCLSAAKELAQQARVDFADDKTEDAVAESIDALRLGQVLVQHTFTVCRKGRLCQQAAMVPLMDNLERLSVADCRRIRHAALKLARQSIPISRIMDAQLQVDADFLDDMAHRTPDALISCLKDVSGTQAVRERVRKDPKLWDVLIRRSDGARRKAYDELRPQMAKPYWQRKIRELRAQPDDPLTPVVSSWVIGPNPLHTISAEDVIRIARLRLLAVHAAIAAYRKEYHAIPSKLTVLGGDDLVLDPCSGRQLIYKVRDSNRYTLHSVGPDMKDDGGKPLKDPMSGGDLFVLPHRTH